MARLDNPSSSGRLKTYVVDSGENITVGPEHDGTMLIFNVDSSDTLYIGDYTDGHAVPIGTVITICTADDGFCYLNVTNANVYGAGFDQVSNDWFLPENTIGTLVKIDDTNRWMISGASLGIN